MNVYVMNSIKSLLMFVMFFSLSSIVSAQIHHRTADKKKLFILLGQSNMAGRAPIVKKDSLPLLMVKLLNDKGDFEVAENPLNRYSNIRKKLSIQKLGPGYAFAKRLSEEYQDTIFIVVNARGGTSLERVMKNDSTGYYVSTISRIKQALKKYPDLELGAIIWHQGESNREYYKDYVVHLRTLIKDYRTDLDVPDLPFIAGEIGRWNPTYTNIVKQIAMIPDSIDNAYLISSEELGNVDEFHFDSNSQEILGNRYAEKYIEISTK